MLAQSPIAGAPIAAQYAASVAPPATSTVTRVTVTPAEVTLAGGAVQQFDAVVSGSGTPSQGVTWTRAPAVGTLSADGQFAAPATSTEQTIDIFATSTQDPGVSGMATVTIPAAAAPEATPENPGFSRSKTRTIKVKAAPLTFEGSAFWDLSDSKHPVGTIDPDATIDISFDWTEVLADIGETELDTVQFDIDGLTSVGAYFIAGYATIFVKSPTDTPRITSRITTKSTPARIEDRTIFLKREDE